MGDGTGIAWTDATWSPTIGCDRVSPGCDHCYAMGVAHRFSGSSNEAYAGTTVHGPDGPDWSGRINIAAETRMTWPLRAQRPRLIFVNSMSDLFHDQVPTEVIAEVFAIMAAAPQHTFQVLTKRHGRMRSLLSSIEFRRHVDRLLAEWTVRGVEPRRRAAGRSNLYVASDAGWPLRNVWIGCSAEDQQRAKLRIPPLLDTPAAVRFISAEPLLGPVDLAPWLKPSTQLLPGTVPFVSGVYGEARDVQRRTDLPGIDWVIAGGESGPNARPMHPGWARLLRDQCTAAGVPYFFKQWGNWAPVTEARNLAGAVWVHGDHADGARGISPWRPDDPPQEGAAPGRWDPYGDVLMRNVGKRAAGAELDGRTWEEMPERVVIRA